MTTRTDGTHIFAGRASGARVSDAHASGTRIFAGAASDARASGSRILSGRASDARTADVVRLDGGLFRMGSDDHYPEEAPAHPVRVDGFRIDRCAVTNAQFDAFATATRYVTVAERPLDPALYPGAPPENLAPGSMVFTPTPGPVDLRHLSQWWAWVPGASWRRPEGPGSGIADRGDHPVVQVAHEDAAAYAAWTGASLPTEAQWEYAARGGLDGAAFTWGDEPRPDGALPANTWDGPDFPWRSTGASGWLRTAPVGSFAPNGYGLYDLAGNVWEWTDDWWTDRHPEAVLEPCCAPVNPRGDDAEASRDPRQPQFAVPRKVIKGGSFLCADTYCLRYRPAARRPQAIDTGMSHVGFRCVRNDPVRDDAVRDDAVRDDAVRDDAAGNDTVRDDTVGTDAARDDTAGSAAAPASGATLPGVVP